MINANRKATIRSSANRLLFWIRWKKKGRGGGGRRFFSYPFCLKELHDLCPREISRDTQYVAIASALIERSPSHPPTPTSRRRFAVHHSCADCRRTLLKCGWNCRRDITVGRELIQRQIRSIDPEIEIRWRQLSSTRERRQFYADNGPAVRTAHNLSESFPLHLLLSGRRSVSMANDRVPRHVPRNHPILMSFRERGVVCMSLTRTKLHNVESRRVILRCFYIERSRVYRLNFVHPPVRSIIAFRCDLRKDFYNARDNLLSNECRNLISTFLRASPVYVLGHGIARLMDCSAEN